MKRNFPSALRPAPHFGTCIRKLSLGYSHHNSLTSRKCPSHATPARLFCVYAFVMLAFPCSFLELAGFVPIHPAFPAMFRALLRGLALPRFSSVFKIAILKLGNSSFDVSSRANT